MTAATLSKPTRTVDADRDALASMFDSIYREANGDRGRIPWADGQANPALIAWLNHVAPQLVRCGSRVCVVGCGLGDDARAIANRGYDVTAFDWSKTAIDWAKRSDPQRAAMYHNADLFDTPPRWRHRFDLVVEIYTLQSLPPTMRDQALAAMIDLMGPHGHVVIIARGTEHSIVDVKDDAPWPLTKQELIDLTDRADLAPIGDIDMFLDGEDPPQWRLRGTFTRA